MRNDSRSRGIRWTLSALMICSLAFAGSPVCLAATEDSGAKGQVEESETSSSSSQTQSQMLTDLLPQMMISGASDVLRGQVAQAMEQAASSFGLVLDTSDLAYVCRDDIIVVNCGASASAGASDDVSVDVGLIYVSREVEIRFGDGEHGKRPPGFYAVRLAFDSERGSAAHDPGVALLELVGNSTPPVPGILVEVLPPTLTRELTVCLDVEREGQEEQLCLGWFGAGFGIRLCLVLMPGA